MFQSFLFFAPGCVMSGSSCGIIGVHRAILAWFLRNYSVGADVLLIYAKGFVMPHVMLAKYHWNNSEVSIYHIVVAISNIPYQIDIQLVVPFGCKLLNI